MKIKLNLKNFNSIHLFVWDTMSEPHPPPPPPPTQGKKGSQPFQELDISNLKKKEDNHMNFISFKAPFFNLVSYYKFKKKKEEKVRDDL